MASLAHGEIFGSKRCCKQPRSASGLRQDDYFLIVHLQGCHEFSSELYQCVRTRVASEHFYFWLSSLKEFSQAEQCLSHVEDGDYSRAMSAIAEALRSYQKGIASLTVS